MNDEWVRLSVRGLGVGQKMVKKIIKTPINDVMNV